MLSPTQPAFAIFGSHNEAVVVNMVQTLAHSSGFPVVIRSTGDNPALTLLCVKSFVHYLLL
jgi:spore coat polysaccharide biosynthesis protein SpsF (cytidylyltransferase family)